ncbi:SpoIIE family protein phosphatase [Streptosporangiaceae bacterium NEAU-GS5]|nr:SpoIIE family protein phosphatase [Streptosporangiaceae bacterium NEAU-GS5]
MTEQPATVLVVDDTPTKRYILSSWLRRAGHQIVEAASGLEALDMIASLHPDLVVLDVRLPDIDGYEVCERIKADPATSSIPIVQVSGNAVATADRAEGLDRGADAYLAEPIEPEEFTATIRATLRYSRARRRAELMARRLAMLADVTLRVNEASTFDQLLRVAAEGTALLLERYSGALAPTPDGRVRRFDARPGQAPVSRPAAPGVLDGLGALSRGEAAGALVFHVRPADGGALLPGIGAEATISGVLCWTRRDHSPIYLGVEATPALDDDEINLLRQLGQELALAVDALRAYSEEHATALMLQRSLLSSRIPDIPGLQVAVRYQPAADNVEVGGDFYEVLPVGDRVLIAVGDVEGHSLRAATVMAELRHALRAAVIGSTDLGDLIALLNEVMRRYHRYLTATVCLLLIDPATGEVEVANAGHIPPIVVDTVARYHQFGNLLLGVLPETYRVDRFELPPGGTILLFTDGLIEDRHTVLDESMETARKLAESVGDDLEAFSDRIIAHFGAREDDVALMIIRRD